MASKKPPPLSTHFPADDATTAPPLESQRPPPPNGAASSNGTATSNGTGSSDDPTKSNGQAPTPPSPSASAPQVDVSRLLPLPASHSSQESPAAGALPPPDTLDFNLLPTENDPTETSEEPNGLGLWLQASPSWLLSMVVHLGLLIGLGLWMLAVETEEPRPSSLLLSATEHEELEVLEEDVEIEPEVVDASVIDPIETVDDVELVEAALVEPITEEEALVGPNVPAPETAFDSLIPLDDSLLAVNPNGNTQLTSGFGGRTAGSRRRMIRMAGGTAESETAVSEALRWLAAHQMPDGSWKFNAHHKARGCKGRCKGHGGVTAANGATGMALLPFFGSGHTHKKDGPYRLTIHRGLKYLTDHQQHTKKRGSLIDDGNMYSHGLAAIALCEAYGMTHDHKLRPPAQLSINWIVQSQSSGSGGWGYGGPGKDTSIGCWQMMAMKSAKLAYLKVPPKSFAACHRFLDSVGVEGRYGYAYYGYRSRERRPATTAAGGLMRMLLGWDQKNAGLGETVDFLSERGPSRNDLYFNYYATQAMFQYTSGKGPMWEKWNEKMRDYLVGLQETEGHPTGSWNPTGITAHGRSGGRIYSTAMAAMILQVYYRHMPVYARGNERIDDLDDLDALDKAEE